MKKITILLFAALICRLSFGQADLMPWFGKYQGSDIIQTNSVTLTTATESLFIVPVIENLGPNTATGDITLTAKINETPINYVEELDNFSIPLLYLGGDIAAGNKLILPNALEQESIEITAEELNNINATGNFVVTFIVKSENDINEINDTAILTVTRPVIGINTTTICNFNIYPNPAKGSVNIYTAEKSDINIYDILGKLVSSFKMNAGETKAFSPTAGMYFVNINGKTKKVVIE